MSSAHPSSNSENPIPEHGWTCFHCWEHFPPTFEGQRNALHHFGPTPDATPGCIEKLTAPERQLLSRIRAYQDDDRRRCEEDTELHRALAAKSAEMSRAVREAEERGYAKGLEDAKRYPETIGLMRASA